MPMRAEVNYKFEDWVEVFAGAWMLFVIPGAVIAWLWGAFDWRWVMTTIILLYVIGLYATVLRKIVDAKARKS